MLALSSKAKTEKLQTYDNVLTEQRQNLPESVENGSVWMQSDHSVFDSDSVDEGLLVIEEVCVWDPELVGNPIIKGQVERDSYIG